MPNYSSQIRLELAKGPASARQLLNSIQISQPTLSRALQSMGEDILRIRMGRSIHYALKDSLRGVADIPIYRVGVDGRVSALGKLTPVRPEGFVMHQGDGVMLHSPSLPWWLMDMRPQGFLGRAYAFRYCTTLGLPSSISDWNDAHVLRGLMAHGHDAMGNLLLGDQARERFLNAPLPQPLQQEAKAEAYVELAKQAASGDLPGSSAGGEQPKFTAFAQTVHGPRHVLVKFSMQDDNPVTQRWRDLLLAEHHALETLAASALQAARSHIIDHAGQRFLEVERFDRVAEMGRRALFSLLCLEAEFIGNASAPWPVIADSLARKGCITPECADNAARLYAFGTLIGNTDMHNGNLSFTGEQGRPYRLAPAYDMLPMGFAPRSGGDLSNGLPPVQLHASVRPAIWLQAMDLATHFLGRIRADDRFSAAFAPCIDSLAAHIEDGRVKADRLG